MTLGVWSIRTCTGYMWSVQRDRLSETQKCLNLFRRKKIGAPFLLFFFVHVRTNSWRHQHAIRSQGYAHTTDSPWLQWQFVGVHQMT